MRSQFFSAAVLAVVLAVPAHAATFSFTGTFAADDDVQLFNFTVGAPSLVTLRSYSYAGGTQADGNVVLAGGFDPILSLFDASGALIDHQDDAANDGHIVPSDPVTGVPYDVLFEQMLGTGNYTVAVSQFDNFALGPNLSDGFAYTGDATFTAIYGCSNGIFCDVTQANRTNAWAFDILNVDSASTPPPVVPLPATFPLLLAGLGAFGILRRRG